MDNYLLATKNMNDTPEQKRCFGRNSNFRRCGRTLQGKCFCDDHRFQPILLLIFLIFTAGTGLLTYKDAIVRQFQQLDPVTISPAKINSPPMFTSQEKMRVVNNGEKELFQVWIKFQASDREFDWNNLTLGLIDEPDQYLPIGDGSMKMSSFIYKIRGEIEGSDYFYLVLDRLETKKKYEFDVKLTNKSNSKSLSVTPNIISYSFDPNLKGTNKDGMGVLSFTPPEKIKLKSISVILKK